MKEKKWFVAYTHSRSEKKVSTRIQDLGIVSFLPMHKVQRKWSDRLKTVEVPLFSSYVFVHTTEDKIPTLMGINGIARFLYFERKFASVPDKEIELIKRIVKEFRDITIKSGAFVEGQRVRVKEGPFNGLEGILIKEQGKRRFILEIEGLDQRLSIDIPTHYLVHRCEEKQKAYPS